MDCAPHSVLAIFGVLTVGLMGYTAAEHYRERTLHLENALHYALEECVQLRAKILRINHETSTLVDYTNVPGNVPLNNSTKTHTD